MTLKTRNIWIFVGHRDGAIEEETFGLIAEARRIISECGGKGTVTAVALGSGLKTGLESLAAHGTDKIIYVKSASLNRYHGELYAGVLFKMVKKYEPSYILMAQGPETTDLAPRLAALLETALVTRATDFKVDKDGRSMAVRPVANGYLFEKLIIEGRNSPIICFLPSVLNASEPDNKREAKMVTEPLDIQSYDRHLKVMKVIEAAPEDLSLEEADIIISGGRGVGRDASFDIIHELAEAIGGSVAGTRPVIDCETLPFERQIGQTGKTVVPRLIFTCGISGANEFTAGMEKSQLAIAINTDPHARIFRFADLSVMGDVQEILPLLIKHINEMKRNSSPGENV